LKNTPNPIAVIGSDLMRRGGRSGLATNKVIASRAREKPMPNTKSALLDLVQQVDNGDIDELSRLHEPAFALPPG